MSAILVVDDDKSLRDLLSVVLRERGHDVETAEEGNAALELMAQARFKEIRALYPDVQIIAMSTGGSMGNSQVLEYARMIGAHESIRKPVELPSLLTTVERMLS